VTCDDGRYKANALVISAGAWAGGMLSPIAGIPKLEVLRKMMFWFPVRSHCYHIEHGGHDFFFEMPGGHFYGFPCQDGETIKVCQHSGGDAVTDPAQLDREAHPDDVAPVAEFIRGQMPDVVPEPVRSAACMYTVSPDHHFIVDRSPAHPNVFLAVGFSGHGFKFVPAIGQALADLVSEGQTGLPIGFLGLGRFAGQ